MTEREERRERRDLDRRAMLRLAGAAGLGGLAGLAGACGWDGGPRLRPALRRVSTVNDVVGEWLLSRRRLARQYPPSMRSGRNFPAYHISRRLPVLADPASWALEVGGAVRQPLRLTLAALQALPRVTYTVKHYCVEGWTAIATWTGVPLATVVALAQPTAEARFLRFDSFDSGYFNGWDLESATHPQTILAYGYNDRPLQPDHGAPVRLYSPVKLGYKLTKYLTRVSFTSERPGGYWEDKGYPWFGGV
jgi:DMSO/TMAO reductase YedYZ molybdopterin-dependent catalytic subunit